MSCEALERLALAAADEKVHRPRMNYAEQRRVDMETFGGLGAQYRRPYHGGRGGRGGGGGDGGGYHHRGGRGRGRGQQGGNYSRGGSSSHNQRRGPPRNAPHAAEAN